MTWLIDTMLKRELANNIKLKMRVNLLIDYGLDDTLAYSKADLYLKFSDLKITMLEALT